MIETILKLREEIRDLELQKRKIQFSLAKKIAKLESLELLTVNQLDLFKDLPLNGSSFGTGSNPGKSS